MSVALAEPPAVALRPDRHRLLVLAGVVTCVATGIAAAVAATGTSDDPASVALARALTVLLPCAAGLCAWSWRRGERFGLLLLATGALLFVTTFAESSSSVPYTIGRAAGWFVEVLLIYLVLAYPMGRLPARTDRLLVAAAGLAVVVGFLPRLVLAEQFPVPNPFTSCTSDCPANALFLLDREPAVVDGALRLLGPALVALVAAAVVVRLWGRVRDATPLARRMFIPVLAIAIARVVLLGAGISLRTIDETARGPKVIAWLLALAVPVLAVAFLVGLARWRLFAAQAMLRLARCLPAADGEALRRAFADAFRDPEVEIVFPADEDAEHWCDARGRDVVVPPPGSGRTLSRVSDDGRTVAGIVHDEALAYEPELIRGATAVAGTALGSRRLAAEARAAMREVRRSRARIAATADRERRRIERDLHDGAQQRLVALRIELELAEDLIRRHPAQGVLRVHELEQQLDEAIDELRALAHGVFPPVLADRGLAEALRVAASRSAVPVELTAHGVGRYPPEVESAVYFCVLEALQNVLKHAVGVSRVDVTLRDAGGELAFAVRDDGAGTAELSASAGRGLVNMRDRMASIGGLLDVRSTPRMGTVVGGRVPAPDQDRLAERSV